MTGEPRWISKKALLMLHEESLAWFGGEGGLRDEAVLDAVLARPVDARFRKPRRTMAELAASYAFGLVKSHAFVDGNKRVAFLAIGLFLSMNGLRLVAKPIEAIQTMVAVAAGQMDEAALAEWILISSRA